MNKLFSRLKTHDFCKEKGGRFALVQKSFLTEKSLIGLSMRFSRP